MQYRHEWKYEINRMDLLILRQRLNAVMQRDSHTLGDRYQIRSLYFDTPTDRALREKLDGVNEREKFRIRYYNGDTSYICLERKSKRNGLSAKETERLTQGQVRQILSGQWEQMQDFAEYPLTQALLYRMRTQGLHPKTIVDYTREPFVYAPGNVRVTLDYDIRTGLNCTDFLNTNAITVPAGNAPVLLEVKWDAFLPDVIRDAVSLVGRHTTAFSKYAQCRIYD